ncbi:MAG: tetratricopeptide repeat protein, partial [Planctomycetota bacterium]
RRDSRLVANRRLASLVEDAQVHRRAAEADPTGGANRWARPAAAAQAALRFARGSGADEELIGQAKGLLGRVRATATAERAAEEMGERTADMSRRLAGIRTAGWESPGCPVAVDAWGAAFRDCGVDVETLPPREAAERLAALPLRREIVAALDDWSRDLRDRGPVAEADNRPLQVLRVLDPDPTRGRIRHLNAGKPPWARRAELITIAGDLREADRTPGTVALLAESLIVAGRPEAAVAPLREALAADPTRARLHFALGWALLSLTPPRPVEARRHFTAVTALKPDCCGARLGLLVAAAGAGDSDEAEEALIRLREDFPGDQRIVAHRGLVQLAAGSSAAGEKTLAAAAAGAAEDPWIRAVHAETLLAAGDVEGALRESVAARAAAPAWRPAQLAWIRTLDSSGRLEDAVRVYATMAKDGTHAAEARYLLGLVLLLQGQGEDAVRVLTEAVGKVPGDPDYWLALGRTKYALGRSSDAIRAFDRALTFRPGFPAARRYRAAALGLTHETMDAALEERRVAVREQPGDADALADLAMEQVDRRNLPAALDRSEEAVQASAGSARARFVRAIVLGEAGDIHGAQESYRMALEGDPYCLRYLMGYGYFLLQTERFADQYRQFKVDSNTRPRDGVIRARLGGLDFVAGRLSDALAHLEAAVEIQPDLAMAHQFRSLALARLGKDELARSACVAARDACPGDADAWHRLGRAHLRRGEFVDAHRAFVRARATGAVDPLWPFPETADLDEARRMLELSERYAEAVRGEIETDDAGERLAFARLCRRKGNHEVAFRFYLEAWEAGGRQFGGLVFPSAGEAAMCAGRLPKAERIARAEVVLLWLEQGLQSLRHFIRRAPRDIAVSVLDRWTHDPGLAAYREGLSLDELPEERAEGFRDFWRRADTMRSRCRGRREARR